MQEIHKYLMQLGLPDVTKITHARQCKSSGENSLITASLRLMQEIQSLPNKNRTDELLLFYNLLERDANTYTLNKLLPIDRKYAEFDIT